MLTAAEICTEARSIAKCAGYSAQSGRALNLVLDDLTLHRNLKVNLATETVSATAGTNGPFNMDPSYLRTYDLFYLQTDLPFLLAPITREQFDAIIKDQAIANYPYLYATDVSPMAADPEAGIPLLYIYPQSSSALSLTHRYFIRRALITTPESSSTIPWMADQDFLIHATALRLMKITDDARYEKFLADANDMLRNHLMTEGDDQNIVRSVKLDPLRFKSNRRLRPTKTSPW